MQKEVKAEIYPGHQFDEPNKFVILVRDVDPRFLSKEGSLSFGRKLGDKMFLFNSTREAIGILRKYYKVSCKFKDRDAILFSKLSKKI